MGKTPEAKVRDPVVRWAKLVGIGHIRMTFRPGSRQGIPDDLFLLKGGTPVFVEFKQHGGEPTKLQNQRIRTLTELGFRAVWFDNADDAKQYLASLI